MCANRAVCTVKREYCEGTYWVLYIAQLGERVSEGEREGEGMGGEIRARAGKLPTAANTTLTCVDWFENYKTYITTRMEAYLLSMYGNTTFYVSIDPECCTYTHEIPGAPQAAVSEMARRTATKRAVNRFTCPSSSKFTRPSTIFIVPLGLSLRISLCITRLS